MTEQILIKNAFIVTMNPAMDVLHGDVLIRNDKIVRVAETITENSAEPMDAAGFIIVPGLIQTHVHLCQALFRNRADDLSLLEWLNDKILPYENKHTTETIRMSARLGLAELIKSGTTTIMDMGTVNHQDIIFEELASSGIRAFAGKAMMDGNHFPSPMKESTAKSIEESLRLLNKWHNYDQGRIKYAFAPRFVLSCSNELLTEAGRLAKEHGTLLHTHASENTRETQLVQKIFGMRNILVFDKLGLADGNLCLAHCIWTDEQEQELMRDKEIKVLHCPSANLKLGSGIAPVPRYLETGITVSVGADGAPCNNNMDVFQELRLASLIQKPVHGPQAMPAEETFKLATLNGAVTLGLSDEIGSIEPGKSADLTFIGHEQVHSIPFENVYSKLIYSTPSSDVEHVMVKGKWLMKNRKLTTIDENQLLADIKQYTSYSPFN
jgi:5-methylthioadenosine/S-adenosylhomocysteine deaminase